MVESIQGQKKVRVLILLDTLMLGGAERQALLLAEFLQNSKNFEPLIVALGEKSKGHELFRSRKFELKITPFKFRSFSIARIVEMTKYALTLRKLNPDIILPFTIRPNLIANFAWQLSGSKACCWNQRDEGFGFPSGGGDRIFNWAIRNASILIANSKSSEKALRNCYSKKKDVNIKLIRNGSKLNELQAKEKFKIPVQGKGRIIFTMIGNLTFRKDQETIIKSWDILNRNLTPDSMPLLILAGDYLDNFENLKSIVASFGLVDHILFPGQVGDIEGILAISDVAINSSISEGMPNTVLEYMLCGKPIVASDILAHRELLGENYRFLFKPRDHVKLADLILYLIENQDERLELGKRNKELFGEVFSAEKMADSYMQLFMELCNCTDSLMRKG